MINLIIVILFNNMITLFNNIYATYINFIVNLNTKTIVLC